MGDRLSHMHDDRHHPEYVVKLPRSFKKGVEYIIRRNVWFQMINTPLVALGICLYRHFAMSDPAQFEAANAYIMKWAMASHDVDVNIDENIGEFMGTPYILGYIAACCETELEDGIPSMNWTRFIKAMTRLVGFYKLNRDYTGKVERLENYAAITDPAIFEKTLREDFAELIKEE